MNPSDKSFDWRIGYAIFCLLYAGTLIYLGQSNFDKVYSEYRQSIYRLQPSQIERIAFEELASDCRAKLKRRNPRTTKPIPGAEEQCQSFSKTVIKNRQEKVTKRLQIEKKRLQRKLIVFSVSFSLFFVALPLYLLYLSLKFLIWLFKDIKISK